MSDSFNHPGKWVQPGSFNHGDHFYPRCQNAQIHPLVSFFLSLGNEAIIKRYCHLHPTVDAEQLRNILKQQPKTFRWAGADLFNVTTADGQRQIVVVETNSCPSGQKSMPLLNDNEDQGGYQTLMNNTVKPYLKSLKEKGELIDGKLAVIYDKNLMEASGYAAAMADCFQEDVLLVEWYYDDEKPSVRYTDDHIIEAWDGSTWNNIRAAFRYVTQKPWTLFPVQDAKTVVINPIAACISGGRNKAVAAKAYDFFNNDMQRKGTGLEIRTPETIWDVGKAEIPLWVRSFGGMAVIKVPYSNAGQGVFTITTKEELENFMGLDFQYDNFIVQSLIGNYKWSSNTRQGQLFHVGTIPDKKNKIYVCDLRMMVHFDLVDQSFKPLVIYARRTRKPMTDAAPEKMESWDVLGTNLSVKKSEHVWDTETARLLLMDRRDFNRLGVGLDELIESYIQTVCSTLAIDNMTARMLSGEAFNTELFSSLNKDNALNEEIAKGMRKAGFDPDWVKEVLDTE